MFMKNSFEIYAGYRADNSFVPLSQLMWDEENAPKSIQGTPLAQHCDIFATSLMEQIVDAVRRPWNLKNVTEMWVSIMPGTHEAAVSLLVEGKRPANYPLFGDDARRIINIVNSWPTSETEGWVVFEDAFGISCCGHCHDELQCNNSGDMPDICPQCHKKLNWALYKQKET